ncbi:unnamed protein product, partial [Phaeothamnion confervicola]
QESGILTKKLKKEGEKIEEYDLVFKLSTENLLADGDKPADHPDGPTEMVVEIAEDAILKKWLVCEGEEVAVGQPVAVLCDDVG